MSFLKFLKREMLVDRMFNVFFVVCFSLGMTGLLFVESFREGVSESIESKARNYAASDLVVSSRREIPNDDFELLKKEIKKMELPFFYWFETYSLTGENARLANIQFVSEEFPFYGGVSLVGQTKIITDIFKEIHSEKRALISKDIAIEQGLKKLDKIKIGNTDFTVYGIIDSDLFTSLRGFTLAPKIYVSYNFMEETSLVKFGSTVSRTIGMKITDEKKALNLQNILKSSFKDKTIRVQTPIELSSQMSRSVELLSDYLSLITLLTYLLSLIGLFYFTKHFLSKRLKVTSIYRVLGVKNQFLYKSQMAHLFILMVIGFLASLVITQSIIPILKHSLSPEVANEIKFSFTKLSLLKSFSIGVLGGFFCIGPLVYGTLKVPVSSIFQGLPTEIKGFSLFYYFPLFSYTIFLSIMLSHSFKVGIIFILVLIFIVFIAFIIFKFFVLMAEKIAQKVAVELKHTMLLMTRFFYTNFIVLVSIMMGIILLIFVVQIESAFVEDLTAINVDKKPDVFMFDLQDRDFEKFQSLKTEHQWDLTQLSPMIRGRLLKVNDRVLVDEVKDSQGAMYSTREEENSNQMKNRSVNVSYRTKLSWAEEIVSGKWNSNKCEKTDFCEISLEERYAKRIGAKINDVLTFDISGVEIKGVVKSFRSVKWTSFEPNFFILFQDGAINEAPKTFLGSFKNKNSEEKQALFKLMAQNFKSTSLIDLNELITKLLKMFDLVSFAIKFISIISLVTALTVVLSISFHHLDMREKDFMLFKLMGFKNNQIRRIFTNEFFFLVIGALFSSIMLGSLLSYMVLAFGFQMKFNFELSVISVLVVSFLFLTYSAIAIKVQMILKKENQLI